MLKIKYDEKFGLMNCLVSTVFFYKYVFNYLNFKWFLASHCAFGETIQQAVSV